MFYISIGFAQKLCRTHMYKLYIYVGVPYYLHMALKYQVAWCHEMIENQMTILSISLGDQKPFLVRPKRSPFSQNDQQAPEVENIGNTVVLGWADTTA